MALASPGWNPRRRMAIASGLVAATAAAWWAWPEPLTVQVADVAAAPVRITLTEPARARFRDRYVVSVPLFINVGDVIRINTEEGVYTTRVNE